jgi:EpsI family protein
VSDEATRDPGLTRRKFALGLAFASVAGVAAARQPRRHVDYLGKSKLDKVLPEQLGQWKFVSTSGLVVPPEDQLARALYSQLLTRTYVDESGQPMMLLVAQSASQTGILQIHRPEICYTAGGYQLSKIEPRQVRLPWGTIPTMSLSATSDSRTEQIVYWTRIGDHLPSSWREQRLAVALDNLKGVIPDAVMVRVSTYGNDKTAALASIDRFISSLMASVSPDLRRVLMT